MDLADQPNKVQVNVNDPTKIELVIQGIYDSKSVSTNSYPIVNVNGGLVGDGSINIISTIGLK